MVSGLWSYSPRGARLARRLFRFAVIAVASVALLTLATARAQAWSGAETGGTARESQAWSGAETGGAVTALMIASADYAVNAETVPVSAGPAFVENIKGSGATTQGQFGAACATAHSSGCPTAVTVVDVSTNSLEDNSGRLLLRDNGILPTKQIPKFRPPCIVA